MTAAHLFDGVRASGQTLEVKADSATINGLAASKAVYLEPWNAETDYAGMQVGKPIPDLAVATTSEKTPTANLTPIMAFANDDAAESYLQSRSISSADFGTEPTFGSFDSIVAPGVFAADITTVPGDGGGPAYVTDQNKNGDDTTYIVGVDSYGPADPNTPGPTKYSYLKSSDYTEAMDQIPLGTDFSGLAADVIKGEDSNEIIRTGQRKADIIINGDDDIILAGSGGGLINTGVGNNDVIFMPSAAGQTDPGTTVVVSPGTSTIVGGGQRQARPPGRPADVSRKSHATLNQWPMKSFRTQKRCADLVAGRTTSIQQKDVSWLYQIANMPLEHRRQSSGGPMDSL